jgi:hypothetical protein
MLCSVNPETLIALQTFFVSCTCRASKETP